MSIAFKRLHFYIEHLATDPNHLLGHPIQASENMQHVDTCNPHAVENATFLLPGKYLPQKGQCDLQITKQGNILVPGKIRYKSFYITIKLSLLLSSFSIHLYLRLCSHSLAEHNTRTIDAGTAQIYNLFLDKTLVCRGLVLDFLLWNYSIT